MENKERSVSDCMISVLLIISNEVSVISGSYCVKIGTGVSMG